LGIRIYRAVTNDESRTGHMTGIFYEGNFQNVTGSQLLW